MAKIMDELNAASSTILNTLADVLHVGGKKEVTDLFKRSDSQDMVITCLTSSQASSANLDATTKYIAVAVAEAVVKILDMVIDLAPTEVRSFAKRNFTGDAGNEIVNQANMLKDRLVHEGIDSSIISNLSISMAEASKSGLSRKSLSENHGIEANATSNTHTINTIVEVPSSDGEDILEITVKITVVTNIMEVPQDILLSGMASAKNRGMFVDYIKGTAPKGKFFKDFIMSLGELQRQVKRDTSKNIHERLIGSLLSKRGLTKPIFISDATETKTFTLIIDKEDADMLASEYNINLTRGSDLRKIFDNMNVLMLVVIDESRSRATIFRSSNPSRSTIMDLGKNSNTDSILKALASR